MASFNLVSPKQLSAEQRFGQIARAFRVAAGISQRGVAEAMAVRGHATWQQTTVTKTEAGERALRLNEFLSLCEVLGHDPIEVTGTLTDAEPDQATAAAERRIRELRAAAGVLQRQRLDVERQLADYDERIATLTAEYRELEAEVEA